MKFISGIYLRDSSMNKLKRLEILTRLKFSYPTLTTDLIYATPFELLIAVMLSARATDASVNKATKKLYSVANTPETLLGLGIDGVRDYIRTIGLFNIKAKNLIKTCSILIDRYNSEIPEDRNALEELPGVGRKTANVVLNIVFKWPTIGVDTHVYRVCNRTYFASGKDVNLVEKKLIKVVPEEFKLNCHNWLTFLGRHICLSRRPRCTSCLIEDLCEFKRKNYLET